MAAAEIDPRHPGENIPEPLLQRVEGGRQIVRVLFAQGVEVEAVQQGDEIRRHFFIPLSAGCAETAAGCAGIVDRVPVLR